MHQPGMQPVTVAPAFSFLSYVFVLFPQDYHHRRSREKRSYIWSPGLYVPLWPGLCRGRVHSGCSSPRQHFSFCQPQRECLWTCVCLCPFSAICKWPQFLQHVSLKTKALNIDVYWPACIATHVLPDCNFSNMKAESVRTKSSWKTFCSFCSVTLTCRYTTCSLTTLTKGFRELRYFQHVLSEQERSSPLTTKCKVSKLTEQIWVICILAQILTLTRL